jgi:hypothetical protein
MLRDYNSSRLPVGRIRLRVSIHQGLVHLDGANGFPGNAVIEVCRLCEAKPLKQALARFPDAGVGLIVSSDIYRDVITEYPEELRPDRFRRVEVRHPDKEFREWAWICVVDEDLSGPRRDQGGDGGSGPDDGSPSRRSRPRNPSGPAGGGFHVGDVQVNGTNAIGHGATAGEAYLGGDRP